MVQAREDPDFLIVARSDANWIAGDFEDTVRRLEAYAATGCRERVRAFEEFMGYREFAERARRNERPRS